MPMYLLHRYQIEAAAKVVGVWNIIMRLKLWAINNEAPYDQQIKALNLCCLPLSQKTYRLMKALLN